MFKWFNRLSKQKQELIGFISTMSIFSILIYILNLCISNASNGAASLKPVLSLLSVSILVFIVLIIISNKGGK